MSEENVLEICGHSNNGSKLTAQMDPEHFRKLFFLCSGKPDSSYRVFSGAIYIELDDLLELKHCITRKLATHSVESEHLSVTVSYKGADVIEFGSWDSFSSNNWQVPERIEEIVLKWDLMLNLDAFKLPQRHILLVRISSEMTPSKYLQLISAGNYDDLAKADYIGYPVFCRVDFINPQISKELIAEVDGWFNARKSPPLLSDVYLSLRGRRNLIAHLIHNSFPVVLTFFAISLYLWACKVNLFGLDVLRLTAICLLVGILSQSALWRYSHLFASKVFNSLRDIDVGKVVFSFTSGDEKYNSELIDNNKKIARLFVVRVFLALVFNIIVAVVSTKLVLIL